jgi:hypothetical protein
MKYFKTCNIFQKQVIHSIDQKIADIHLSQISAKLHHKIILNE